VYSSVTLKVLNIARTAGLVIVCALFLNERVSHLQIVGYGISLVAFGAYNYIKIAETTAEASGASELSEGEGAGPKFVETRKGGNTHAPRRAAADQKGAHANAAVLPSGPNYKASEKVAVGQVTEAQVETQPSAAEDAPLLTASGVYP
jgi:hypothetical protein